MPSYLVGAALLDGLVFPGPVEVPSVGAESRHRLRFSLWAAPLPWLVGALSALPGFASGSMSVILSLASLLPASGLAWRGISHTFIRLSMIYQEIFKAQKEGIVFFCVGIFYVSRLSYLGVFSFIDFPSGGRFWFICIHRFSFRLIFAPWAGGGCREDLRSFILLG